MYCVAIYPTPDPLPSQAGEGESGGERWLLHDGGRERRAVPGRFGIRADGVGRDPYPLAGDQHLAILAGRILARDQIVLADLDHDVDRRVALGREVDRGIRYELPTDGLRRNIDVLVATRRDIGGQPCASAAAEYQLLRLVAVARRAVIDQGDRVVTGRARVWSSETGRCEGGSETDGADTGFRLHNGSGTIDDADGILLSPTSRIVPVKGIAAAGQHGK